MATRAWSWLVLPVLAASSLPWAACNGGNAAAGGTGGLATTSQTTTHIPLAACDTPDAAPSKGACYTIPVHTPPASCMAAATDGGTPDAGDDAGAFSCATAILTSSPCAICTEASCCAEITACNAVAGCLDCLTHPDTDPTTCLGTAITAALNAVNACATMCCQDTCTPGCNPVTNAACAATDACDIDAIHGGYTCLSTDAVAICQMCDEANGPFCAGGLTCLSDGSCGAFCCADGDCGSGKCDKTRLPNETVLGVCVHP